MAFCPKCDEEILARKRASGLRAERVDLPDKERQECEIWTRVMGYHRPIASFNRGKRGEFEERRYFSEAISQASHDDLVPA